MVGARVHGFGDEAQLVPKSTVGGRSLTVLFRSGLVHEVVSLHPDKQVRGVLVLLDGK